MDRPAARAQSYYRALDEGDYETLADLLAPGFVQERPDLTLESRERFVRFMREERPRRDTSHAVDAVYVDEAASGSGSGSGSDGEPDSVEVAVRGRLLDDDGERLFRFVDVFVVGKAGFRRLDTYTQ
jgi:ketosteroid isomerase-like protein